MKVRPLCKPGPFRSLLRAAVFCTALLCMLDLHAQDAWAANSSRQKQDQSRDNPRKPTENRLSLQVRDEKLSAVLDRIEQQTPYVFVYSNDEIAISRKITLQVKDRQLNEILDMLLSPLNIRYELINNKIILKQGNVGIVVFTQQENHTISGRVVGENGEGLPGVNIRLKGKPAVGTVSSETGDFTLKVPAEDANGILVCTYVGYLSTEVPIGGRNQLTVLLRTDSKDLSEVVITAYGSQKKKQVTAAISTISTKDIESRPVTNMFQALQGTAPNLTLQQATAEPGASLVLNIRGVGSSRATRP